MKIILHPEAIKNFNKKSKELLLALKICPTKIRTQNSFNNEIIVNHTIEPNNILNIPVLEIVNYAGEETSISFYYENKEIGLFEGDYTVFKKIVQQISIDGNIKEYISYSCIKSILFEWIHSRYRNQTSLEMWEYVCPLLEEKISEREIWIPIFMLQIESNFTVGNISFRKMNAAVFDEWEKLAISTSQSEEHESTTSKLFREYRENHQGYAAATIMLLAESGKAEEIAFIEAEKAIDILRIYDIAFANPLISSNLTLAGIKGIKKQIYFEFQSKNFINCREAAIGDCFRPFRISSEMLEQIKGNGLDILSNILKKANTPLQKDLLIAIQIYSNSLLATNITDKIISMLVSLESLLLKADENIQQNIGERMAFAITKDGNIRKEIIKNLKFIYNLRSGYIHHANEISIEHVQEIESFMKNVWLFYNILIKSLGTVNTKLDLINKIDDMKLYGN